jgi:hypothetical protein
MNIVNIQIKRKEGFSYYKGSHKRYDITLKVRNMNSGQAKTLESAIQKACADILPEREVTPIGKIMDAMEIADAKQIPPKNKGGRPKGSKNKKKVVK